MIALIISIMLITIIGQIFYFKNKIWVPAIIKALTRAFEKKKKNNWSHIYFYFDVHETVLYPDYDNTTTEFYPHAKDVLQYLSTRNDIVLALYTCSYPTEIERYQKFFKENNINFKLINKNPEVENNKWGYFKDKPYFNVLFEDKAGFDAEHDWIAVKKYFKI